MITRTQLEIVRGCNINCFYCLKDDKITFMDLELAKQIIQDTPISIQIWLQGYGEPALYPYLEELAIFTTSLNKFIEVNTITNGKKVFNYNLFNNIHFSCDSVEDTGSGKYLGLFEDKLPLIDRSKVGLWFRIVDYGQDYRSLINYCRSNNIRFVISPLEQNTNHSDDYAISIKPKSTSYKCTFTDSFRGYFIDGHPSPCCILRIDDKEYFTDRATFDINLRAGIVPPSCDNCTFLVGATQ